MESASKGMYADLLDFFTEITKLICAEDNVSRDNGNKGNPGKQLAVVCILVGPRENFKQECKSIFGIPIPPDNNGEHSALMEAVERLNAKYS